MTPGNGNGNPDITPTEHLHNARREDETPDTRTLNQAAEGAARDAVDFEKRLAALEKGAAGFRAEWREARREYGADRQRISDLADTHADLAKGSRERDQWAHEDHAALRALLERHAKRNDDAHAEMNTAADDRHKELLSAINLSAKSSGEVRGELVTLNNETDELQKKGETHAQEIARIKREHRWRTAILTAATALGGFIATNYGPRMEAAITTFLSRLVGGH